MGKVFHYHFRVRADECDSLGHVNNAVYIRHLQQATLDALGDEDADYTSWNVRTLAVEYHAPARYRDDLDIVTWVIEADASRVVCGYKVRRSAEVAPVASAQIEWDYRGVTTHQPRRVLERFLTPPKGDNPAPLKSLVAPRDNGAQPFSWRHRVRRYELDATNRVATAAYFNWLEEATFRAADLVGWSLERLQAENIITFQRRHDAEFFGGASIGDDVEIISRLIKVERIRGTWLHEIFQPMTDTLLMRDYSTGAFLDWEGNIKPAPTEMMEELILGEPMDANAWISGASKTSR